jgi:hypothetical protein
MPEKVWNALIDPGSLNRVMATQPCLPHENGRAVEARSEGAKSRF